MNSEWPSYRLGDLTSFKYGKFLAKSQLHDKGFPVFSGYGVVGYLPEYQFDAPQLLMVCRGEGGTGDVKISPPKCSITNLSIIFTVDESKVTKQFLYWALKARDTRLLRTGSAQAQIVIGALENFRVEVPTERTEQIAIAQFLDSLDERITLLRETNATLEAIAQALFKSWFVDYDPVRAKQEGRVPEGMDEATALLFPDGFEESELGFVPKRWRVQQIDTWLEVLETGRRPKGGVSGFTEGVPSIGAESIVRIGQFDYSKTKFVSEDFFSKMKSGELQSHDVLLYKDGGKPGVFLPRVSMFGDGFPFERCGINEHVFRIRVKRPLNQAFLYFWVWSDAVVHELKHRGGKAAIPGINQSDVRELKLAVPNEEVLNAFDELASPLISKIFSNAKQAQTLSNLRDTLLPRLISGQLRLPEAEALAA